MLGMHDEELEASDADTEASPMPSRPDNDNATVYYGDNLSRKRPVRRSKSEPSSSSHQREMASPKLQKQHVFEVMDSPAKNKFSEVGARQPELDDLQVKLRELKAKQAARNAFALLSEALRV